MPDFRTLPPVNDVLELSGVAALVGIYGRDQIVQWIRAELDTLRAAPENLKPSREENREAIATLLAARAGQVECSQLGRVINATGVILHTGLGRAPLGNFAVEAIAELAQAGNVEVDLTTGDRRYRGHQLQDLWQQLTGCEDSVIVNNNAAATLLTLQAMCDGREVIISRGQLIEIGGSFRLPKIFELSGAKLREVGTTNRTKLSDYEDAIGPNTAAIMHVHPSNYRVVGFTSTPKIRELAELARKQNIPSIDDIGSGSLVDVQKYGLPEEPTWQDSFDADADVVLGSGDKLLGGPQAGIILGKSKWIEMIRNASFARTVRVDKLTLAALAATLKVYVRGTAEQEIPTLRLMSASVETLLSRAEQLAVLIRSKGYTADVLECDSPVGGGSLPGAGLPSAVVAISSSAQSASELSLALRTGQPRVFSRVQDDRVIFDLRSVLTENEAELVDALPAI